MLSKKRLKSKLLFVILILSIQPLTADESVDKKRDRNGNDQTKLPLLGETQKLSFNTNEGTWLSLDVSPDGKRILFDLLGDLYTVPISGGKAVRITQGLPYDAQPQFSPDGEWMTYVSDHDGNNNLWIAKTDGSDARKLTSEKQKQYVSPIWTPDGNYIVATRSGNPAQFRMFHKDGGSGLTLSKAGGEEGIAGLGGSFSPNGRYLYFTQRSEDNRFPSAQIHRYDMHTGIVDPVTRGEGGGLRPVISPDGTLLIYASRYEAKTSLRIRSLITEEDKQLIWPIQRDSQERGGIPSRDLLPSYDFTPDGRHLVMHSGGKIQKVSLADGSMSVIPFDADIDVDIGPDLTASYKVPQGNVNATIIHDPILSNDGKHLALSALTKIYTMDAKSDAKPTRLTKRNEWEYNPVYSPDGRWVAYVTWSIEGGHIWRARSNGRGKPERLTQHAAFYSDLTFSPDGNRIVAVRGNAFQRQQLFSEFFGFDIPLDLIWLPAKGGKTHLIAPARGARTPHFTRDPNRVFVYDGKVLFSINFDGTDKREHLSVEGPKGNSNAKDPVFAEDIRISPNGEHALALVGKQVWLMPLVNIGEKELNVHVRGASVPVVQLTSVGADFMGWTDNGEMITWALGSTFYQRSLASVAVYSKDKKDDKTEFRNGESKPTLEENEHVSALKVVVSLPRNTPNGTVVLRGGNVIAMLGNKISELKRIQKNVDVVITNNRIAAIGPQGDVNIPTGAEIKDVTGKYITPGFIDTHAHFEFRNQDVLEPHNWSLAANLAYGVTSGLDVQTSTKDYFTYRDMVETGQSVGIRAFMTGPGIFGPNDFQSYDATLAYLRRYSEHYNTNNIKSYLVGNRQQRQWVVKAAKELGLMPTTEGGSDMKLNITHAIDGMHGNEHTLPDGPIYNDVIELYARTKTAYTPTLIVQYNGVPSREYFFTRTEVHDNKKLQRFYPHNRLDEMTRRRTAWVRDDEFSVNHMAKDAAAIQRAGGLVGIGGHGEVQGLGYHWEMWSFAMGDAMMPVEILRAATVDGAKIIGIDQDLGTLEPGKLADLVILDKNPLDDIRNTNTIYKVMKNGELYEGDTLNQEWPEKKMLTPFWWWKEIGISQ